jgi:membrane-associated phospholipid phosphatase
MLPRSVTGAVWRARKIHGIISNLNVLMGIMSGVFDPRCGSMWGPLEGYQVIQWVQSVQNPLLDWLAMAASFLGTDVFFLLFVPVFYWCWSKRDGVRLALVFLLSIYFNAALKGFFHAARPDSQLVRVLYSSSGNGYSFPSGHAQNAMVFWGWLGRRQPWRSHPLALAAMVLLISLSRIYLGLHFPIDIAGGWLLGASLLVGLVIVDHRISRTPKAWEGRLLPWMGLGLPLVFLAFHTQPIQALISGAMLGFCLGYLVESRWIQFLPEAPFGHQLAKAVCGLAAGGGIALILKKMLPPGDCFVFVRYAALGLWVSLGLPATYLWLTRKWEVASGRQ